MCGRPEERQNEAAATVSIARRAFHHWRQIGTGLAFVLYGLIGWLGGLLALPVVWLWPGTRADREHRVRWLVSRSFRCLLVFLAALRVGDVTVEGCEWLKQAGGKLVIANHPMYLDVVALVSLLPQADCIIKSGMWQHPLYRRFVAATGYLNNHDGMALIDEAVERLERGHALLLFPEGTRSTPSEPLTFQRGAAQIVARGGCDILPVVITCKPLALGKHQAWHEVGARPWQLHLRVLPPQSAESVGFTDDMSPALAARHINRNLEALFRRELGDTNEPDRS